MSTSDVVEGTRTFQVSGEAYARFMGRYSERLAREFVRFAGVERGMRALDVGCGTGVLTAELTRRLGPHTVVGADPSEPFLAAARAQVPAAEFVSAQAERLPFGASEFDATLAQLVLNFMTDPEAGVCEMARVTAPGGVVAACVWDYAGGMRLLREFWAAAREVKPETIGEGDKSAQSSLGREGGLTDLWRRCGLQAIRTGDLWVKASYSGFDDLWSSLLGGVGPAGAFCVSLPQNERAQLCEALRERLGVAEGPFELEAHAWAAVGTPCTGER